MNSPAFLAGLAGTLLLIIALSVWFGTHRKSGHASGHSMPVIAGLIIGTLVGGSSTVGTAQLAFTYGFSAWWYTLGGGISCLVLALVFVRPFRKNGASTLTGMIGREYGEKAGMLASVLNSLGTIINIISQIMAATAVIAIVFPQLGIIWEVIISVVFMLLYGLSGGTRGASVIGMVKTVLLYVTLIACGVMVLSLTGGAGAFADMVKAIDNPEQVRFFSLFARGISKDASAGLSLVFGVITTQIYAQAVLSARTDRGAVGGALISAFMIPPIGIGGILVGLYMRAHQAMYPLMTAKTALTTFVVDKLPPVLSGIILGTLFITVIGAGAGLSLGVAATINENIVKRRSAATQKVLNAAVLMAAGCLATGVLGDIIFQYSFLSMALRSAVVFCPLCACLFLPGKIGSRWAIAAIITGPLVVFAGNFLPLPVDALFFGIGASFLILAAGLVQHRLGKETEHV